MGVGRRAREGIVKWTALRFQTERRHQDIPGLPSGVGGMGEKQRRRGVARKNEDQGFQGKKRDKGTGKEEGVRKRISDREMWGGG